MFDELNKILFDGTLTLSKIPKNSVVKLKYSEKATKFCEISTILWSACTVDNSKVEIPLRKVVIQREILWPSQNVRTLKKNLFVASFL